MPAMLAGVLLFVAQASLPDLTITTHTTFSNQKDVVHTRTIQVKKLRQRLTLSFEYRNRTYQSGSSAVISQCDLHQEILLNDAGRIFHLSPMRDEQAIARARAATARPPDTRPVAETITVDAVDTGERRRIGPLEARHVTTTWTTDATDSTRVGTRVIDGWYVDLPAFDCQERGNTSAVLIAQRQGVRTEIKWRGKARTGTTIAETERTTGSFGSSETTTALVSISDAPLPDALFDIPTGYRPALMGFNGSVDMQRPDTWVNRASLMWETARAWLSRWWR
jgi:hypothetical protein